MMTMQFGEPKPETYSVLVTGESPSSLYGAMVAEYDTRPAPGPDGLRYGKPRWSLPVVDIRIADEGPEGLVVTVMAPDAATAARRVRKAVKAAAKHVLPL